MTIYFIVTTTPMYFLSWLRRDVTLSKIGTEQLVDLIRYSKIDRLALIKPNGEEIVKTNSSSRQALLSCVGRFKNPEFGSHGAD